VATAPAPPPGRAGRRRRHPLIRLAGTVARLPRYLKLAQGLAGEPAVAARHKAALGLGIGYAVLPFDLLPGVIPVVGQMDDLAALLLGIRHTLRACPADVAAAHLARAGLKASALDDDLRVVAVATVWLVSGAASLGLRAARAPGRLLARVRGNPLAAAPPRPRAAPDEGAC
jgi:uncharacterized membrane protein YkvA (DUF1232 family)